jgi:hypothetical protein
MREYDYSPIKCEHCHCYMPSKMIFDKYGNAEGLENICTPCTQSDKIMDNLLNYRL